MRRRGRRLRPGEAHQDAPLDALPLGAKLLVHAVRRLELRGRRRGRLAAGAEPVALWHGEERALEAAQVVRRAVEALVALAADPLVVGIGTPPGG